ncbi:DUF6538 domain-containing protein [Desulfatitalea tepidiphila]|uniref:DUF6538 domain-containing protein n=1 Tax=Desulfatitalea tepidiphila TaxID=1185843 RepID=UPI00350E3AA8
MVCIADCFGSRVLFLLYFQPKAMPCCLYTFLTLWKEGGCDFQPIGKASSHLVRNLYRYCFRLSVPIDSQRVIGKKEVRYSLKSGYLGLAKRRLLSVLVCFGTYLVTSGI